MTYGRMRNKTLVFIGGAHYSGTSLLHAVLDASPLTSVRFIVLRPLRGLFR